MTARVLANYNGKEMYLDEVTISPLDRGFLFGDAVYDVIRVYQKKPFLFNEHIERLTTNLDMLKIRCNMEAFQKDLHTTVANSPEQDGMIYVQITRGTAPRVHYFPDSSITPNVLIWVQGFDTTKHEKLWSHGCSVITYPESRWSHPHIKTVNLLGNCMAKQEAVEKGSYEAIFVNNDNYIMEASSSNVFGIQNGILLTAPTKQKILPGITRQFIFGLAKEMGLETKEHYFTQDEFYTFDEVFITGTTTEVMPVVKVDDKIIGSGEPGDITKRIQRLFFEKTRR
ncbi:MAG: aminotransferase class IV [bacterium]|nr:aminotransferase class IV [bacterium]MBU1918331.1 aminotransferase class IV [bacterium]